MSKKKTPDRLLIEATILVSKGFTIGAAKAINEGNRSALEFNTLCLAALGLVLEEIVDADYQDVDMGQLKTWLAEQVVHRAKSLATAGSMEVES